MQPSVEPTRPGNREPRILSRILLDEFSDRLVGQRAAIAGHWSPGIDEHEIDALVTPLGLRLPIEARVWWGWHDGTPMAAGAAAREIGPGIKFIPLAEAVHECQRIRTMMRETALPGQDPAKFWPAGFLPFTQSQPLMVLDASVAPRAASPVWAYDFHDGLREPNLASLGNLVSLWIDAIDGGAWRYDGLADRWIVDHDRLPTWVAKAGLA